jgi:hypothetical protein
MRLNPRQELSLWGVWAVATLLLYSSDPERFFRYDPRTFLPLVMYSLIALAFLIVVSLRARN